ncbi:MAG: BPSS1780 family membrane protein [Pseudomonadota bacterium]
MSEERNPYAAPRAPVLTPAGAAAEPGEGQLRAEPAKLRAGAGADWISAGWELFKSAPMLLVLVFVLYLVLSLAAAMIPVVGDLFMSLTFGLWSAAFYLMGDKLRRGESIGIGDLFAGFQHRQAGRLFGVGLVYVGLGAVLLVALFMVAMLLFGINFFEAIMNDSGPGDLGALPWVSILLVITLLLVGVFLILASVIFAPALVAFHDVPVLTACGMSLKAMLRNWPAMTIYGLIVVGLAIASIITLFLAWLVLMPLLAMAGYVAYRQIFVEA